ncbi:MAG TPA: hypothetical protein IAB61_01705 [Candidatus Merdisoma merdipullorum]|nr:hypothetical protein [Candidatus Merdisoma merdipullorum]
MDRELFRNGSEYVDPTAYKAIVNVNMEKKNMETKPFEIWKYEISTGEKMGIVMAQDRNIVSVLPLFEKPFADGIEITTVQGVRFVHPVRMAHVVESKLISYVQDVPEESVNDIMNMFSEVYSDVIWAAESNLPESEESRGYDNPGETGPILPPGNIEYPDNTELQIRLEGERREKEVYKGLYEGLLDKLIK